ncbi:MAG: hypothetical protein N2446_01900 [Elusimicrobiales bacterium]|nr:hypothetical protein [Elusimicrobiales bacterium]
MNNISINRFSSVELEDLKKVIFKIKNKELKNEELEKAIEDGFKRGYEEGYSKLSYYIKLLSDSLSKFDNEYKKLQNEFTSKVLEVSFAIAEKILKYEIEKDKYINFINSHLKQVGTNNSKIVFPLKFKELIIEIIEKEKLTNFKERIEFSGEFEDGIYIKTDGLLKQIDILKQLEILKEQFLK